MPQDLDDFPFVVCPEKGCDQIAGIEWNRFLPSTDGPVEMVKIRCVQKHWFLMPREGLDPA